MATILGLNFSAGGTSLPALWGNLRGSINGFGPSASYYINSGTDAICELVTAFNGENGNSGWQPATDLYGFPAITFSNYWTGDNDTLRIYSATMFTPGQTYRISVLSHHAAALTDFTVQGVTKSNTLSTDATSDWKEPVHFDVTPTDNGVDDPFFEITVSAAAGGLTVGVINALLIDDAPPVTTPIIRKSSTFDIETILGTITTATLNSVNVFDHVTGQVGTTVSFEGAATDEITTSGEYTLTLGDGAGTEDITVQVNVVGVAPSNNPLQKDGSALASLTGVQVRVTDGANLNGTELEYLPTATTDASGNLGNIDLSSTAAAVDDSVLLHMRTAAGDSIIAAETVGLI